MVSYAVGHAAEIGKAKFVVSEFGIGVGSLREGKREGSALDGFLSKVSNLLLETQRGVR